MFSITTSPLFRITVIEKTSNDSINCNTSRALLTVELFTATIMSPGISPALKLRIELRIFDRKTAYLSAGEPLMTLSMKTPVSVRPGNLQFGFRTP